MLTIVTVLAAVKVVGGEEKLDSGLPSLVRRIQCWVPFVDVRAAISCENDIWL
jgi:hypothetical protein